MSPTLLYWKIYCTSAGIINMRFHQSIVGIVGTVLNLSLVALPLLIFSIKILEVMLYHIDIGGIFSNISTSAIYFPINTSSK